MYIDVCHVQIPVYLKILLLFFEMFIKYPNLWVFKYTYNASLGNTEINFRLKILICRIFFKRCIKKYIIS